MFDLSLAELGVIGVVALLVLGPERLPKAARTVGFYVRKARQSWYSVRSEFERELAAEELKRSLKLDEVHATLDQAAREARQGIDSAAASVSAAGHDARAQLIDDGDALSPEERARQTEALPEPAAEGEPVAPDSLPATVPESPLRATGVDEAAKPVRSAPELQGGAKTSNPTDTP
jgi:sec-independent protein translocase protein TatB